MKIRILILVLVIFSFMEAFAQSGNFDERIAVGNGLYKVKSHDRWGIVDSNDNLKLSLEYNEPLFMNGRAVITAFGSKKLVGIVDSIGQFTQYPDYNVNTGYPFVCDDMLAVQDENGKWGFLDIVSNELLKVHIQGAKTKNKLLKSLGINGKSLKGSFVFDYVAPFIEGMAVVFSEKTGWHHIDKYGEERFKDSSQSISMFRTSLHNGESVIFNDKGIVLCKETPDHVAGIVNYLENEFEIKDYHKDLVYPYIIRTNGSRLILNTKFQADKFENFSRGDSVILIERPKVIPQIVEKKDSFNLERDIKIELAKKSVSAGSKGTASVTLNIQNNGSFISDSLCFVVNIKGTRKEWNGVIKPGETVQVTLYVPAKFSTASITREVSWILKDSSGEIADSLSVTIKRYKPSRR